jgi:hypothetical protein
MTLKKSMDVTPMLEAKGPEQHLQAKLAPSLPSGGSTCPVPGSS